MKAAHSAALLALAPLAAAFWRLECHGVAGVAMIDPIADPGVTAAHAHTIKGGSGLSVSSTADDLLKSDCTSCQVTQDKSSYWAPQLFFQHHNGSTMMVPEVAGHLTYYKYTPVYNANGTLMPPEALPNGLRAISGDKTRRNFSLNAPDQADPPKPWTGKDATQDALAQKAIGFNCLDYSKPGEPTLYRHSLPNKEYLETKCPDGIRMEILFPQCWDGRLDSDDHQSHLAFPDALADGGKCPEGFDHNTMQILFETIYPTQGWKGVDGFYALSTGDPTGNSYHADYLIAWDEGVLQQALDKCGPDTGLGASGVTEDCPVFKTQNADAQGQCKLGQSAVQKVGGLVQDVASKMPGNNPIAWGPAPALAHAGSSGSSATTQASDQPKPTTSATAVLSYSSGTASYIGSAHIFLAGAAAPTPEVAASPSTTLVQSVITPAPAAPASPQGGAQQLTTVTYTSAGAVYHEVIVQDNVVVTQDEVVTVTQNVQAKRSRRARHLDFHNHGQ